MKKLIIILLCLIAFDASSQNQVIDPTVEVNRDFEGKMMEVRKGELDAAVADSLYNFKVNFNYSFFEKPYKDMYEFAPLASANLPQTGCYRRPQIIAKAGIGYPLAPEAEVLYSPELKNGNYLNLNGAFNMFSGNVPLMKVSEGFVEDSGEKAKDTEYKYGINGEYVHAWKSGEINLNAGFTGGYSTYLGNNAIQHHNYWQANAGISAKSSGAEKYGKKFNYAATASLQHTQDKMNNKLQENLITVEGEMGPTVGRYNKFMVGASIKAATYSGTADYNYGTFGIVPQYRFENRNMKINVGVKIEGKFTNGTKETGKYHNPIFPIVDLTFGMVPRKLWLYGKVDGWNNINTYSSLLKKNTHINPESTPLNLMASSVPLNIEAGLKGRFTDKFAYTIYGGYSVHKGLQQFIFDQMKGWFDAIYSNHNELYAGASAELNTERMQGGFKMGYSSFSNTEENHVLGLPQLQGNVYAVYNWNKKIYISARCHMQGKYNASAYTQVHGFADLQAGAEYVHSPMLSFWIKGENLLGTATQYHPFYAGRTRGFVAGIIVKL